MSIGKKRSMFEHLPIHRGDNLQTALGTCILLCVSESCVRGTRDSLDDPFFPRKTSPTLFACDKKKKHETPFTAHNNICSQGQLGKCMTSYYRGR